MANIKLLQEAIQAFANGDESVADKKMRAYFVETAQEINKKLSEEMDDVEADEEELNEDLHTGEADDMEEDIGYKLDEEEDFEDGEQSDEDEHAEEVPDAEQWESIKDAFDDLERMFDEIGAEEADEFEDEEDDEAEDDFSDVDFGDENIEESYEMKKVQEPEKKEKANVNKKSPVASNAKAPVEGAKPVKGKSTSTEGSTPSYKEEDHCNVLGDSEEAMKPVKEPKKEDAANKDSVLPKK